MTEREKRLKDRLLQYWPTIVDRQDNHLKEFGHYFQGLPSTSGIPDGDKEVDADLDSKPTDQETSYSDFWRRAYKEKLSDEDREAGKERVIKHRDGTDILTGVRKLHSQLVFNVSEGPSGKSWCVTLRYRRMGVTKTFTKHKDGTEEDWAIEEDWANL